MKFKSLLLIVLSVIVIIFPKPAHAQVNTTDSLSLISLYRSTNGTNWKHSRNWLSTKPVSTWEGITVVNNRVTQINLHFNRMSGRLPDSIGYLTALTDIDVSTNRITGSVPASMGNLANLVTLYVNQNNMSGYIPGTLGQLSKLQELCLAENGFSSISDSVGNIKSLTYLWLYANKFTGPIPAWIGNLTNLNLLWIRENKYTGTIPAFIWNLTKLTNLDISNNMLTGSLSEDIGKLTELTDLQCSENQLSGPLPQSFGTLKKIQRPYFDNNQFSGPIPDSWGNLTALLNLQLGNNNLTGNIPTSFSKLVNLTGLTLDNNNLSGQLPVAVLAKMKNLGYLSIKNNHFTSSVNFRIPDNSLLYFIDFSTNNFNFNGLEFAKKEFVTTYYAPQAIISLHKKKGDLSVNAGGTLSNNTYNWHNITTGTVTAISGDSTFTPTAGGMYYATITNKVATALTLYTDTISFTLPLIQTLKIAVTPNPAVNTLTITGLSAQATKQQLTVTDISGHVWLTAEINARSSTYKLDISSLKPGNYVLNITDAVNKQSLQFIKQ